MLGGGGKSFWAKCWGGNPPQDFGPDFSDRLYPFIFIVEGQPAAGEKKLAFLSLYLTFTKGILCQINEIQANPKIWSEILPALRKMLGERQHCYRTIRPGMVQ